MFCFVDAEFWVRSSLSLTHDVHHWHHIENVPCVTVACGCLISRCGCLCLYIYILCTYLSYRHPCVAWCVVDVEFTLYMRSYRIYILYATLHWCILISKARTFAAFPISILFLMQPFLFAPLWNSMLFICFHSVENQKEKNTRFVSRSVSFYRSLSMTDRFYGERSES